MKIIYFLLRNAEIITAADIFQPVIDLGFRLFNQIPESSGTEFFNKLIRVFCSFPAQHPDLDIELLKNVDRPLGGFQTGSVTVISEDDFSRIA